MADDNTKSGLKAIGSELSENPPAILNATRRKFGAGRAAKQKVAILLSKGRKSGLKIAPPR